MVVSVQSPATRLGPRLWIFEPERGLIAFLGSRMLRWWIRRADRPPIADDWRFPPGAGRSQGDLPPRRDRSADLGFTLPQSVVRCRPKQENWAELIAGGSVDSHRKVEILGDGPGEH